jgi:hypothetical protein
MKRIQKKSSANTSVSGSALILTVVLTSLLAIVGVLFVMASRVDSMATSAVAETKELDFAIDTIMTNISRELVLDVPGVAGQEYYDYYDVNDTWLAALEPYQLGTDYYWRQISDLYNGNLDPNLQAVPVPDYQGATVIAEGVAADADGDGVMGDCAGDKQHEEQAHLRRYQDSRSRGHAERQHCVQILPGRSEHNLISVWRVRSTEYQLHGPRRLAGPAPHRNR